MEPVNIGIIGLGTVGAGTVNLLERNSHEITRRAGREIKVKGAAVRDSTRPRACETGGLELGTDPFVLTDDPEIEVIVELMGGDTLARDIVIRALKNGKHVVTANKALVALHGNELFEMAREKGLVVAFEAAVAGGVSIIKVLREGLAGNCIEQVVGIVNGTTNFILSGMSRNGLSFDSMLEEAKRLGYAEADPSFDIDGVDAAHKLTILSSIAFGIPLDYKNVYVEGIRSITSEDIGYAEDFGFRIKHLGIAKRVDSRIELRVHPCLLPAENVLANVDGVMNAVLVVGDATGPTIHYGAGAGAEPTASSVVADIVDVVRALTTDPENRVPHLAFQPQSLSSMRGGPMEEVETAYYLRLLAFDQPGVLADVARILGQQGISIESIRQRGTSTGDAPVPIVMITHNTLESRIENSIPEIEALPSIAQKVVKIRLENMKDHPE